MLNERDYLSAQRVDVRDGNAMKPHERPRAFRGFRQTGSLSFIGAIQQVRACSMAEVRLRQFSPVQHGTLIHPGLSAPQQRADSMGQI